MTPEQSITGLSEAANQVQTLKWIIGTGGVLLLGAIGSLAVYVKTMWENAKKSDDANRDQLVALVKEQTAAIQRSADAISAMRITCPCKTQIQNPQI